MRTVTSSVGDDADASASRRGLWTVPRLVENVSSPRDCPLCLWHGPTTRGLLTFTTGAWKTLRCATRFPHRQQAPTRPIKFLWRPSRRRSRAAGATIAPGAMLRNCVTADGTICAGLAERNVEQAWRWPGSSASAGDATEPPKAGRGGEQNLRPIESTSLSHPEIDFRR